MAGTTVVGKGPRGGLKVITASGGFQQIAVLTSSQALTIPVGTATGTREKAKAALISIDGAAARVRFDGSAPTSAIGHLIANGDHLFIEGDLAGVRIIQAAATAVANISYFA